MNQINITPPRVTNAGLDFDYSTWTPGTIVELFNVPWNSDYRDIVKFNSTNDLDNYLRTESIPSPYRFEFTHMSYARPGEPLRVPIPMGNIQYYNYARVYNPSQQPNLAVNANNEYAIVGDNPTVYYYFINDMTHIAPNTTQLNVQLDVWQTWNWHVKLGRSFIERGHIAMADRRSFNNYGRDYLTVPEGLDIGNEYVIDQQDSEIDTYQDNCSVVVFSTINLYMPVTDRDGNPKLNTARGTVLDGLPSGQECYFFKSINDFTSVMAALSEYPWVTQGFSSLMVVPTIKINATMTAGMFRLRKGDGSEIINVPIYPFSGSNEAPTKLNILEGWRDKLGIPARYKALKKFQTFPYTFIEATSYMGTPIVLKPELLWKDSKGAVPFWKKRVYGQPSPRLTYIPYRYNARPDSDMVSTTSNDGWSGEGIPARVVLDGGEWLDMTTGISSFPTFALVNNAYLNYMASNRNTISYGYQSADWSQQKAMRGADVAFGQAGANMQNTLNQAEIGRNLANTQTGIQNTQGFVNAGIGAVGNAAQGALLGGGVGAIANAAMGFAQAGANAAFNNMGTNANNAANIASTNTNVATQEYMRDTNRDMAQFAAKGDYSNAIAGINAKVQDAKMLQPTTVGQVGGEAFTLLMSGWGLFAHVKTLSDAAAAQVGEYWLRYGYAVGRFAPIPQNFQVMSHFTYWKLTETYISSSVCPEAFKQAIRGIFEKGVTVWAKPKYIGIVDNAVNKPIEGIYL